MTPAETRYATVELELMAIIKFTVITDHRPLVGIFSCEKIDTFDNHRIVSILDKVAGYDFEVSWIAGKNHRLTDALWRSPADNPMESDNIAEMIYKIVTRETSRRRLLERSGVAILDQDYMQIMAAIESNAHPKTLAKDHPAISYTEIWDFLSLERDLIWYNNRIIVPQCMRRKILNLLHRGHSGINMTMALAKMYYYWPGITNDISQVVGKCEICQQYRASQPKEVLMKTSAMKPMEPLSCDLFTLNRKNYLITVDRYSGFPWVHRLKRVDTLSVTKCLKNIFMTTYFNMLAR